MTNEELQRKTRRILVHGPNRVLINDAEALSPKRARELGHTADIIFIRDDGWSLGASCNLENAAYDHWPETWVGFVRKPNTFASTIDEYRKKQNEPTKTAH